MKISTAIETVNQAMQALTLHLPQASKLLQNLKELLQSLRDQFAEAWQNVTFEAAKHQWHDPELPRVRRTPRRLNEVHGDTHLIHQ
jgi:iron-sulfur cluster repair protein YtfE (RIC family)